jgi:hypothetical protein
MFEFAFETNLTRLMRQLRNIRFDLTKAGQNTDLAAKFSNPRGGQKDPQYIYPHPRLCPRGCLFEP